MMHRLFTIIFLFTMSTSVIAESWDIIESQDTKNDRVIIFRYLKDFSSSFNRSTLPVRVIITWEYRSKNSMPNDVDNAQMIAFEDLLHPAVRKNSLSTLVLVSTGDGLKEWIYYTKSENEFIKELNNTLKYIKPFPIQIHIANDPMWNSYDDFLKNNEVN